MKLFDKNQCQLVNLIYDLRNLNFVNNPSFFMNFALWAEDFQYYFTKLNELSFFFTKQHRKIWFLKVKEGI